MRATSSGARVVAGVHDRDARGRERLEELPLHPDDPGAAAEVLGVGEPDVGHDPDVGPGDLAEVGDVAGEAGTHLGDDDLGGRRCREQRERQAELVVVGADARVHR